MMRFKYIGSGKDSPVKTVVFGHEFTLDGEYVEIKDPNIARKLRGNRTFVLEGQEKPAEPAALSAAENPAELTINDPKVDNPPAEETDSQTETNESGEAEQSDGNDAEVVTYQQKVDAIKAAGQKLKSKKRADVDDQYAALSAAA